MFFQPLPGELLQLLPGQMSVSLELRALVALELRAIRRYQPGTPLCLGNPLVFREEYDENLYICLPQVQNNEYFKGRNTPKIIKHLLAAGSRSQNRSSQISPGRFPRWLSPDSNTVQNAFFTSEDRFEAFTFS